MTQYRINTNEHAAMIRMPRVSNVYCQLGGIYLGIPTVALVTPL
jgi:hypothetical protein